MSLPPFTPSQPLTLGVELELQLLRLSDLDLIPAASDVLAYLGRRPFPGDVKPEITDSMIEVSTDVQSTYAGLLTQLQQIRDTLVDACDTLNVGIAGGGTHPFQFWPERRIYPGERYQQLSSLYGYLAKQFTIFGQHIHVGVSSGDDALYVLHRLSRYVPHFIALSASSPFYQGVDSLFDSARLNSVFAFPLSGRAPVILEWAQFEQTYFQRMTATGVVASMKDFYWDIRPKPEYGTVELRVCDTPLSVERAAALAGYLQTLVAHLLAVRDEIPEERDYDVYTFNRFQACRFGLDGLIVDPRSFVRATLRDDIKGTLDALESEAQVQHTTPALAHLHGLLDAGNDATWLRTHAARGNLGGVLAAAMTCFRT